MFTSVYKQHVTKAFQSDFKNRLTGCSLDVLKTLRNSDVRNVRLKLQRNFRQKRETADWARACYLEGVKKHPIDWTSFTSSHSCSTCLGVPQYRIGCGHSMCAECVQRFGEMCEEHEYVYSAPVCPLCGSLQGATQARLIKLKPPTAGVRVLSVDAGGMRGLLALQHLQILESTMGSAIAHFVDFGIGTSVGGLIVTALLVKDYSITMCADRLVDIFEDVFPSRPGQGKISLFDFVKSWVRLLRSDSTRDLEPLLYREFGLDPLFGNPGCKVAVTAVDEDSSLVLPSYNGSPLGADADYGVFHTDRDGKVISLASAYVHPSFSHTRS